MYNKNNKKYWNEFYTKDMNFKNINNNENSINNDPSDFCKFILNYFEKNNINIENVLDCGFGNGRDTFKLIEKYNVDAVDNSGYIPSNNLQNKKILEDQLTSNSMVNTESYSYGIVNFYNDDFIKFNKKKYDLIYSRFTFHSITNNDHIEFFNSIKSNSYLALEARSDISKDELHYFGKTHYRNYINLNYLIKLFIEMNFKILYIEENNNFAIYKNENPICIRAIVFKL